MTVGELLVKKMDEMNANDFEDFAAALGYQFGLVLARCGIKDISKIDRTELIEAMMDQQVAVLSDKAYGIIANVGVVRARLFKATLH